MKTSISLPISFPSKIAVLFLFLFVLIKAGGPAKAQHPDICLEETFDDKCAESLKSIFDDYIYLRSRAFSSLVDPEIEFTFNLKKSALYVFNIFQGYGEGSMVIELYDVRTKNIVATSLNPKTKINDKMIVFLPKETGKYYIKTYFQKKDKGCCLIMFGMVKKNIKQYIQSDGD